MSDITIGRAEYIQLRVNSAMLYIDRDDRGIINNDNDYPSSTLETMRIMRKRNNGMVLTYDLYDQIRDEIK